MCFPVHQSTSGKGETGSNIFPLRVDPFSEGNKILLIFSLESVSVSRKMSTVIILSIIRQNFFPYLG